MRWFVLLTLVSILEWTHSDSDQTAQAPKAQSLPRLGSFQQHLCLMNKPLLAAGDFNISRHLLAPRIRKHKHLLLGVSSSRCLSCCHQEEVLQGLHTQQQERPDSSSQKLAIGRIDCSEHHEWFAECETTPLPFLMYISDTKERLVLRWSWPPEWVDKQIENLEQPVTNLESEVHILKFLNKPNDEPRSRAILAVLSEDHAFYPQYQKLAKLNYWWLDQSFGLVSDPELAQTLRKRHPRYFHEGASMTIASVSPGNAIFSEEQISIFRKGKLDEWLNSTYLSRPIEQYTSWTARLVSMEAPLLLLFIAPANKTHVELVRSLEVLAKKQLHKINFMWVDATKEVKPLMLSYGLRDCILPCVSLRSGTLTGNHIFPLEASPVLQKEWVSELVRRYFDRELIDYSEMVHSEKSSATFMKDTFLNETELAGSISVLLPTHFTSTSRKVSLVLFADLAKLKNTLARPVAHLKQNDQNCLVVSSDPETPEAALFRFNFVNRLFAQYLEITDTRLQVLLIDTGRTDTSGISALKLPHYQHYQVALVVADAQNATHAHRNIRVWRSWTDRFDREDIIAAAVETLLALEDKRRLSESTEIDPCDQVHLPLGLSELRYFRTNTPTGDAAVTTDNINHADL